MPSRATLPRELWVEVISLLSRSDQRTCLFLSRVHRAASLRYLFGIVHISLGIHGRDKLLDDERSEREDAAVERSFEVLEVIIFTPVLAVAVKKMVVYAFACHPAIFERGILVRALRVLPHLRSFAWVGIQPRISGIIINALQNYCSGLREFIIDEHRFFEQPTTVLKTLDTSSALGELKQLTHVEILSDELDYHDLNGACRLIFNNEPTLRHLSGADNVIWPSIRNFSALTHLEITRCDQVDNLHLVFRHATQLRSLDLSDTHFGVFKPLGEAPDALPELTSFRLSVYNSIVVDDEVLLNDNPPAASTHGYQIVIRFLENKGSLRRLYLNIEGCTVEDVRLFIDYLPSRARLEILGIDVNFAVLDEAAFTQFARALPEGLKMFSFGFENSWGLSGFYQLYDMLTRLPRLELLRLWMGELRFAAEDVAQHFEHLHTLALGQSRFWDVDRCMPGPGSDSDAPLAVLERWSYRRAKHRCPEDFRYSGCDAEWLLRPPIGAMTGPD